MRSVRQTLPAAIAIAALSAAFFFSAEAAPAAAALPLAVGVIAPGAWVPPPTAADGPGVPAASTAGSAPTRVPMEGAQLRSAPAGTTVGAPGLGALPYFGFEEVSLSLDTVARVNLGNGNLLLTSSDGVLNGPGLSVRNDRYYNGLDTQLGNFGGGWSSALTNPTRLTLSGPSATFHGPNGFTVEFTETSARVWDGPDSFEAELEEFTSGTNRYVLTYNQTGEELRFSEYGVLLENVNRNGVGSSYSYDSGGRLSEVLEASGRFYTFTWDTASYTNPGDYIESVTDSAGRTVTYSRDTAGRLIRVEKPDGVWEEFDWDSQGRLSRIRGAGTTGTGINGSGTRITFAYDSQHRVTEIRQGTFGYGGNLSELTFTYAAGQSTVTDLAGNTTTYTIDSAGRVEAVEDALGNERSQTWTAASNIATSTDALASGSTPGNTTTYSYDTLNNATGAQLPTGAAASAAYARGVGCAGTGGDSYQVKCSVDDAGNGKQFDYDSKGNLTGVTDSTSAGTGAVTHEYTHHGVNGASCGGFTGQVCTTTDGNGNTTAYAYDADGNLVTVTPPTPAGPTTYTYDSLGRVEDVTDGNGDTTSYSYNQRDETVQVQWEDGATLTSTYYPNGLLASETDSLAGARTYLYDTMGRVLSEAWAGGHTNTYTYDQARNLASFGDHTGVVKYVYDDANQLTQVVEGGTNSCPTTAGSPAASGCVKLEYDANGNETLRTLPGNATIATTYDASGRITRITARDTGGTIRADVGYSHTTTGGTGPTADRTNVQTRTSHLEQGIPAGAVTSYAYDSLDRLTAATERVGSTVNASWAYGYDDAGNRTTQTRTGATGATAGTVTYTYDAAYRITGTTADTTTWSYDAVGNQLRNGITGLTATYDTRQAVTSIGASIYTAFGQGNTTQLSRNTDQYNNAHGMGMTSEALPGGVLRAYTRTSDGEGVGVRWGGTARYYYASDALGSTIGLFDRNGTWGGGYSYTPYGEPRSTSAGATANSLQYTGGYRDTTTGLYKFGARYYDPTLGRFTQNDPSGQETNPCLYVGADPINNLDPTGLSNLSLGCLGAVAGVVATSAILAGSIIGATASVGATLLFTGSAFAWLGANIVAMDQCLSAA